MLITRSGSRPPSVGHPALPGPRVRGHVQVGDVQHPDGPRPGGQHRHLDPAQPEGVHLVQPGVRQAAGPTAPTPSTLLDTEQSAARVADIIEKATSGPACETGPCPTAPSTLKERLRSDLTTAIKDRDKVRSGTIRMVLTAISEAEVAGAEAVELSDQQVLDVVIREAKKRREAEEAYANAGRAELAEKERAESDGAGRLPAAAVDAEEISDHRRRRHRRHRSRRARAEGHGQGHGAGHAANQGQGRRRRGRG